MKFEIKSTNLPVLKIIFPEFLILRMSDLYFDIEFYYYLSRNKGADLVCDE